VSDKPLTGHKDKETVAVKQQQQHYEVCSEHGEACKSCGEGCCWHLEVSWPVLYASDVLLLLSVTFIGCCVLSNIPAFVTSKC